MSWHKDRKFITMVGGLEAHYGGRTQNPLWERDDMKSVMARGPEMLHGRGVRPKACKMHKLGKPDLHEEKSTTTKVQGQMCSRYIS